MELAALEFFYFVIIHVILILKLKDPLLVNQQVLHRNHSHLMSKSGLIQVTAYQTSISVILAINFLLFVSNSRP